MAIRYWLPLHIEGWLGEVICHPSVSGEHRSLPPYPCRQICRPLLAIFLNALQTTDDNFVDISESAIPGPNAYTIEDNGQRLCDWLFAVYVHTPTVAYADAAKVRIDKATEWAETLKSFATYSLPAVCWDARHSPDPS